MFRKRLRLALAILAVAAIAQGSISWWSLNVATNQVQRGRVASDILTHFQQLSATKQRLKTWASQAVTGLTSEAQLKDRYLDDMQVLLAQLQALDKESLQIAYTQDDDLAADSRARAQALTLLASSVVNLRTALAKMAISDTQQGAEAAWKQLADVFDLSGGQDLRTVLSQSIAREELAVQRERQAADRSLALVSGLALGATLTLGLAASLFALYFSQALRRPLDDLQAGTEALQRGDLSYQIPARRRDEFGKIAMTLNALATELQRHQNKEVETRQQLQDQVQARTNDLQRALHKLQLMDARRRQLFADISHELRTPTTAIRGEAEVTLRGKEKPVDEYKAALSRIAEISMHLSSVINDLLDLARNDIEALSIQHEAVNVNAVLEEALVQTGSAAQAKQIAVVGDVPQAECQVSGDPHRLRQLFSLVLDNAIQYSLPGGRVEVKVQHQHNAEGTPTWKLEVIDEGIGIDADDMPRIFERKFRGKKARAQREDGSGLGLNIAQTLARAHDGTLLVHSQAGVGTQVAIELPTTNHPA